MGILFGGYVAVHLIVNATGFSPLTYQRNVDKIHDLEPMLPAIEIIAIFTPLLFHLVYGFYISFAGVSYDTTTKYRYGGNVRYVLQRISAMILVAFVLYHVLTLHKWGLGWFRGENQAYQSTVDSFSPFGSEIANLAMWAFYLLGIWAATFHFANGLWTAAIAWGLTTTAAAQKRWGYVCCAAGIALTLVGTAAWVAFTVAARHDVSAAETFTRPPAPWEVRETTDIKTLRMPHTGPTTSKAPAQNSP